MQIRVRAPIPTFCALALTMEACVSVQPAAIEEASTEPQRQEFIAQSGHSPPFARMSYEQFSRTEAIAISTQEWRLFGQLVYDDPPRAGSDPELNDNPNRSPGIWERIGEYWWLGQDASRRESTWTGMHDESGQGIADGRDGYYAWSAAFISYVMRTAGAGARFPYAPAHYIYIDLAKDMKLGRTSGWAMVAEPVGAYAPAPGDLICFWRNSKRPLTYDKLPARRFAAHCDMVVSLEKEQIRVIGGNVNHAVAMKHVPVTADGRLTDSRNGVLDARYPGGGPENVGSRLLSLLQSAPAQTLSAIFETAEKPNCRRLLRVRLGGFDTGTIRQISLRMPICLRSLGLGRFTLQAFFADISMR